MIHRYWYLDSDYLNHCSIRSELHILILIGGVTIFELRVSVLYNIYLQCNTISMFTVSNDTSIHCRMDGTTGVSGLNSIVEPGYAK
jgi:hypothetical protein